MALPTLLFADQVGYSIGSFNDRVPPTKFYITADSITSNVATLNGRVLEGNIPVAGQLISTTGLVAIPNVTSVAIATVTGFTTGDLSTGAVTYALTNANVTAIPDSGFATIPQGIVPVVTASTAITGTVFTFSRSGPSVGGQGTISWIVGFPTNPSTAVAVLEASVDNNPADFSIVDTYTGTTGSTREVSGISSFNFFRIAFTTLTGSGMAYASLSIN
jgi:hypothetical protein